MEYNRRDYIWGIILGVTIGFNGASLLHHLKRNYSPVRAIQTDINLDGNKDLIIFDNQKNSYLFLAKLDGSYVSLKAIQKAKQKTESDSLEALVKKYK